jgi:hypothetical protein
MFNITRIWFLCFLFLLLHLLITFLEERSKEYEIGFLLLMRTLAKMLRRNELRNQRLFLWKCEGDWVEVTAFPAWSVERRSNGSLAWVASGIAEVIWNIQTVITVKSLKHKSHLVSLNFNHLTVILILKSRTSDPVRWRDSISPRLLRQMFFCLAWTNVISTATWYFVPVEVIFFWF